MSVDNPAPDPNLPPSTPDVGTQVAVYQLVRTLLYVLGTAGIALPAGFSDASVLWQIAGGLALTGTAIWHLVHNIRVARANHLAAVTSARLGRAVRATVVILAIALSVTSLTGCATDNRSRVLSVVTSPVGSALVNALIDNLAPGVNSAIAKGVSAAGPDLDIMAEALPWVRKAVGEFGPMLGVSAVRLAEVNAALVEAEVLVANPPTDAASAVAAAAKAWQDAMALIHPAIAVAAARRG